MNFIGGTLGVFSIFEDLAALFTAAGDHWGKLQSRGYPGVYSLGSITGLAEALCHFPIFLGRPSEGMGHQNPKPLY